METNDVTCNYENVVSMATEIYLHRFAVDSIQTLHLKHMTPGPKQYLVVLSVLETLLPWQLKTTFIILALKDNELHAWQTYSFLGKLVYGLLVNIEML